MHGEGGRYLVSERGREPSNNSFLRLHQVKHGDEPKHATHFGELYRRQLVDLQDAIATTTSLTLPPSANGALTNGGARAKHTAKVLVINQEDFTCRCALVSPYLVERGGGRGVRRVGLTSAS